MNFDEVMNLIRSYLVVKKPFIHLVISSDRDFNNFSWKWMLFGQPGFVPRIIRGKKCSNIDNLFSEFGAALQFPYYFGENWHAFDECLKDLKWLNAMGYILFISNTENVLSDNYEDFEVFMNLLISTIKFWTGGRDDGNFPFSPTPFHIVFHCIPEEEESIKKKFRDVNITNFDTIILNN